MDLLAVCPLPDLFAEEQLNPKVSGGRKKVFASSSPRFSAALIVVQIMETESESRNPILSAMWRKGLGKASTTSHNVDT